MSSTGDVDNQLLAWLQKTWKKKTGSQAGLVKEICIGHFKGAGAPDPVCVITKDTLDSYADTREMARDLDERMIERARNYPGMVRFEIVLWGGGGTEMRHLASEEFRRQGQGRLTEADLDTSSHGQMTMYMREAHRDRELTITTLTKQIEKLDARNERLHNLVDQMMARYPELLDLMSKLADGEVERDIKRRQAFRIEGVKDRALQRLDQLFPIALNHLTGGKLNLLAAPAPNGSGTAPGTGNPEMMAEIEPHLLSLLKSLAASGERGLQIGALMNPEEQTRLMAISSIVDQYELKAKEKAQEKEIGVKQKNGTSDAPAPSTS